MSSEPLVSIIIPCYNDAGYIEEAVFSAINQTYAHKEIIVVDDGSDARTRAILKKLKPKINKLVTQENQGLSSARNTGINASIGDLILTLDSDDYFEETFCEKAVKVYKENFPDFKIITCKAKRFDNDGVIDVYCPRGGGLKAFMFANSALGNALFSKEDWQKVGGFDEKMFGYEDWEFFIRVLRNSGSAYVIPEALFFYRQKDNSLRKQANSIKFYLWEYIFKKHKSLYLNHYDELIEFYTDKLKKEETGKLKNQRSREYKVGEFLLKPIRLFKKLR